MLIALIRALIQLGGVEAAIQLVRDIASGKELSADQREATKAAQLQLEDRIDVATGHGSQPTPVAAQPAIGRRIIDQG